MAHGSRTETRTDGNTKTTYSYSIDTSGFGYNIFDENSPVWEDLEFLITEMPNKLDEIVKYLQDAGSITNAFQFNDVHDINMACENVITDISVLKSTLAELHAAFVLDIENVNAELAYNFGWVRIGKVKGVTRRETIEENKS